MRRLNLRAVALVLTALLLTGCTGGFHPGSSGSPYRPSYYGHHHGYHGLHHGYHGSHFGHRSFYYGHRGFGRH